MKRSLNIKEPSHELYYESVMITYPQICNKRYCRQRGQDSKSVIFAMTLIA